MRAHARPGEFALIEEFVKGFGAPASPHGPGDDAAVLPPSRRASVVTTDAVVEGVHFTRPAFSLEDVGHKALAVNLSDVAAMGARPTWALCALGLPAGTTVGEVQALSRGLSALARTHGVSLVGGNVTRSPVLSLTLTVAGTLPGPPLLRSTGRKGDVLYLSGYVGDAAAGLALLARGPTRLSRRQAALARAQRRPSPHLAWAQAARRYARAAIDVSDGFLQDLGHLCAASGVGADVHSRALPLSPALQAERGADALALGLTGGEDYVLLVAVPAARARRFEAALGRAGLSAFAVGELAGEPGLRLDGQAVRGALGFQHL